MRSVDQRIVEMRINNQQFEKGAKESINTLDQLKKSLDLEGAEKNLKKLDKAGKEFSLEGMAKNIETISSKFTNLGIVGTTVLQNITNSAIRTGKQLVDALTLEAPKMGFSEYETQINAIQTILANTKSKGTTLDEINAALDELNSYADLTIYNFTQMTESIGRFTAAGLDLDVSTASIKGLSNLAAMAGSTSQQLNTAMFQLSQGLSAGTIKLEDWNSLRTANMTNESFRESLIETARVHGIAIDQMISKYGSLEYSLQEGWLTSEVMMETLLKFTGDYSEAEWIALGYTEEQAKAIVELGKTAMGAATDVKTFTQLIDTTKEALQSGWTQSWEIIVGDFEESKELWTGVSNVLGNIISESANSRNAILQSWKDLGGRKAIIDGLSNTFEALVSVVRPISQAFKEIFPPVTGRKLVEISNGFKDFTKNLKLTESQSNALKSIFKGLFSIADIGIKSFSALLKVLSPIGELLVYIAGKFFNFVASIGDFVTNVDEAVFSCNDFASQVKSLGKLQSIKNVISGITDSIKDFIENVTSGIKVDLSGDLMSSISGIVGAFRQLGSAIWEMFSGTSLFQNIAKSIEKIKDSTAELNFTDIVGAGSLAGIALGLKKFIDSISGALDNFSGFGDGIKGVLDSVTDSLKTWQSSINADTLMKIAKSIGILALSLIGLSLVDSENIGPSLMGISVLVGEMVGTMKILNGLNIKGIASTVVGMIALSSSILMLSGSLAMLKQFENIGDIAAPLTAIVALMLSVIGAAKLMSSINGGGLGKTATSLLIFSVAVGVLSKALISVSSINFDSASSGLLTMGVALAGIAAFSKVVSSTNLSGVSLTMIALSTSMVILGKAMQNFVGIDISTLLAGFSTMGVALASLAISAKVLNGAKLGGIAVSLLSLSVSMAILSSAMNAFSSISWTAIVSGFGSLAAALLALTLTSKVANASSLIGVSVSLGLLATSLTLLTVPITILGALPWQTLAQGIVAIVAAMLTIGGVTMLLAPFSAGLLAVSGALALFGATVLAIGAGITLLASGLAILATSAVAGASALLTAVPVIGEALLSLILTAAEVIQIAAPTIMETVAILIQSLLETLVAYGPSIGAAAWELFKWILHGLATVAVELLQAVWGMLQDVGSAIADFVEPMFEAGKNLVQGLVNGVLSLPGAVADAAKNLGSNLLNGLKDFLGIHSPSTESFGIGGYWNEGLVNGVVSGYGDAESAGAGLGSALQNGTKKSLSDVLSGFESAGAGLGSALQNGTKKSLSDVLSGFESAGTQAGTSFSKSTAKAIKKEKSPEEAAEEKAKEIKERFEKELKGTELDTEKLDLEFENWEAQSEKTVKAQEYYVKKKEYINKKIEYQTQVTAKAEEKYQEMVKTFGESSNYAREAYNEWLTEQKELTELGNDLADLTDETVDKINDAYDKMNKTLENRATRLDLEGQLADSMSFKDVEIKPVSVDILAKNVTKAENEYRAAVIMFGKDSDKAVAAYEKLQIARDNYTRNQDGVFDAELEYKRAIKEYGEDSEEAIEALEAYEQAKANAARRKDYSSDLDEQLSALEEAESYYKSIAKEFGEDSEEASYAQLLIEQAQADLDSAQNALNANNRKKAYSNFTSFLRGVGKYGPQAEKASNALAKYKELLNVPGVDQATLDEAYNDYLQEQVNLLGIVDNFAEEAGLGEGAHAALNIFAKALGDNWPLVTDKWGELIDDLGPILEEHNIDSSVIDFVKKIFKNPDIETVLSEGLSGLIKSLLTGDDLPEAIKTGLKGLPDIITKFLPNIGNIFSGESSGIIGGIAKILPNIASALSGGLGGIFKGITGFLGSIFPKLGTLLSGGLGGLLTSLAGGLSGILGGLGTTLSGVVGTVGTGLAALASSLGPVGIAIAAVGAALVALLTSSKGFRDFIVNAFGTIGKVVTGVFTAIKKVGVAAFNVIRTAIETVIKILEAPIKIIKGILDAIVNTIKTIVNFFTNFKMPSLFGGGGGGGGGSGSVESEGAEGGKSLGGAIIDGAIQGITNPIGSIVNGIKVVGGAVVNGFKNFFGIHSPSKVFAKLGGQLMDGLVVGIGDSIPKTKKSIDSLGSVVNEEMANLISNIDNIAEPTIRPVLDTSNITNGAKNLSGLFSKNSSVKLSGNVNGARTAMYSADKVRENQNGETSESSSSGSTYSFVQNNYSPKALSKSEIYRQTKNQFSMLKGRA